MKTAVPSTVMKAVEVALDVFHFACARLARVWVKNGSFRVLFRACSNGTDFELRMAVSHLLFLMH